MYPVGIFFILFNLHLYNNTPGKYPHMWSSCTLTETRKTAGTAGKPRRQQIPFRDIQIKVIITHRQIYVYHTDLLPLKSDFDLSRSPKVKSDVIELAKYGFPLMVNSNIGLNSAPLWSYDALKSEWPWLWPFKVTQGQMSWCDWTRHIWFPIDDK